MVYIVMAYVPAYILMAYMIMTCIVMTYIDTAYTGMADRGMAYTVLVSCMNVHQRTYCSIWATFRSMPTANAEG